MAKEEEKSTAIDTGVGVQQIRVQLAYSLPIDS